MAERLDCLVIGAGVVGLAVARALALSGREVVILEAAADIGTEISSRNSEVIHAGIYYPPGSLKAKHCVAGKALLYRYCRDHHIAHEDKRAAFARCVVSQAVIVNGAAAFGLSLDKRLDGLRMPRMHG